MIERCIPAARTGAIDSLSRETRKDMRNGIRLIALIAWSALFEVSLKVVMGKILYSMNVLLAHTISTKVSWWHCRQSHTSSVVRSQVPLLQIPSIARARRISKLISEQQNKAAAWDSPWERMFLRLWGCFYYTFLHRYRILRRYIDFWFRRWTFDPIVARVKQLNTP